MQREYLDMHLICQDLRVWLDLEIPLIEDGNSFGECKGATPSDSAGSCCRTMMPIRGPGVLAQTHGSHTLS